MKQNEEHNNDNPNIIDALGLLLLAVLSGGDINNIETLVPSNLSPAQTRRRIRIILLAFILFLALIFIIIINYGLGILVFLAFGAATILAICGFKAL